MIDSPNDSDESSEEVIYSQGSSKVDDVSMDYNWDLDRFVEYNSPLKGKAILSPDNNSSHWNRNKNNSSVMTNIIIIHHDEMKLKIKLKNRDRISVGFEVVFKMRVLKHTTVYILFRLLFSKIIW
jgi:hypothetical protein